MKTIQKLTLGLLTVVAASSLSAAFDLTIDVTSGSATHSANINAGTVNKTGCGELVLQGADNSALGNLTISAGSLEVETNAGAMPAIVTFDGGSAFQVDVAAATNPSLVMTQAGQLEVTAVAAAAALTALSGAAKVTVVGSGRLNPGALGASTTPMDISGIVNVGTAGHELPNSAVTVLSSGLLDIQGVVANSMPGTNVVNSGATLQVDASLAIPAAGLAATDFFGTLKFDSGSTLKLGNGASWARAITVGSAL